MFGAGARKVKNGQAAPAILPFSHSVSAADLILTEMAMNSFFLGILWSKLAGLVNLAILNLLEDLAD